MPPIGEIDSLRAVGAVREPPLKRIQLHMELPGLFQRLNR